MLLMGHVQLEELDWETLHFESGMSHQSEEVVKSENNINVLGCDKERTQGSR